ncbi:terminase large subunit [Endozoicomonas sp. ISHI1]|uniref:terminase large subunit n=1 Tax=Endozoicomonas sp. ISHI1 TaxID=2825882 RepID=UPI0021497168|nr:terminase TerL endonuclease subunit [Endozoicomonas sp. ISHI1]
MAYPHVNAANKYARDVVSGRIPACKWVKLACQRHLDDLNKKGNDWLYRFDKDKAENVCNFIELLPHVKAKWGQRKELISLEPWQAFNFCCVFGWVRKKDGHRRFREVYNAIPRKNGKSVMAAGVALVCFAADGEYGAEVYSGATTEKQAWEVFSPAKKMVQKTPELREEAGIEVNAKNLAILEDGSKLEPLIGDPGDGSSPSCALIDEYHEHKTSNLYDTMRTGMGARSQPLLYIITTAGFNISGPCFEKQKEVEAMLEGTLPNEELFGIIYTIDPEDDWTDPASLRKANPNMGVSVSEDFLLSELQNAINITSRQNKFKTKHLNIWCNAKDAWLNLQQWEKCGRKMSIEDFRGVDCWDGLDLASRLDICSHVKLFKKHIDGKDHYYCFGRHYLPENTINASDNNKNRDAYQNWVNMCALTATDGDEIDFNQIKDEVLEQAEDCPPNEIAYDQWRATQLAHQLEEEGASTIEVKQGYALSPAMRELEAAIQSGRFHHDGNPVMTWMASNVVTRELKGNLCPMKESNDRKIDGMVALLMAMDRAMSSQGEYNPLADYDPADLA